MTPYPGPQARAVLLRVHWKWDANRKTPLVAELLVESCGFQGRRHVMPVTLHVGDEGPRVQELQRLLGERGYTVGVDGEFGPRTESAVRAFQSQNLDRRGEPLKVDGAVGSLTWWSLTHAKPTPAPQLVDFGVMPAPALGGSSIGRAALETAIGQLREGAGEVGGNNMG